MTETRFKSLREYVDVLDRLYKERDEARKTAVDAALKSADEKTVLAFSASEKANVKAEQAQDAYNTAHNDLLRKMDDQHKETLPRLEANEKFKGLDEKIENQRKEIAGLRESRSGVVAVAQQETAATARTQWSTGMIVTTILGSLAAILSFAAIVIAILLHK